MKVQIVTEATGKTFSIEAGMADGRNHFDHHREHSNQPAPCRDERIPVLGNGNVVEITHIDADSYVGLLRMAGKDLPDVDLELMETIDLNGSSVVSNKFDPTLLYMVGVGEMAREVKFPRASADGPTDVTSEVEAMMTKTAEELIELGRIATTASEATYADCKVIGKGVVGLWSIGADNPLDPSRPYEDGTKVVVVYRQHYQSISIYCAPDSDHQFGGTEVAGIQFAGHPKACGSPRGTEMSLEDAKKVYEDLLTKV